ncbi:MAG: hypothetical protein HeimC2_33980 [Candidatus Heimdallarchaeota archaeon LC_2]|nr:MAG: hypothetical protein HeimC2_33980 [Candidatus Heimdallarchaeota archaeon LC_2]
MLKQYKLQIALFILSISMFGVLALIFSASIAIEISFYERNSQGYEFSTIDVDADDTVRNPQGYPVILVAILLFADLAIQIYSIFSKKRLKHKERGHFMLNIAIIHFMLFTVKTIEISNDLIFYLFFYADNFYSSGFISSEMSEWVRLNYFLVTLMLISAFVSFTNHNNITDNNHSYYPVPIKLIIELLFVVITFDFLWQIKNHSELDLSRNDFDKYYLAFSTLYLFLLGISTVSSSVGITNYLLENQFSNTKISTILKGNIKLGVLIVMSILILFSIFVVLLLVDVSNEFVVNFRTLIMMSLFIILGIFSALLVENKIQLKTLQSFSSKLLGTLLIFIIMIGLNHTSDMQRTIVNDTDADFPVFIELRFEVIESNETNLTGIVHYNLLSVPNESDLMLRFNTLVGLDQNGKGFIIQSCLNITSIEFGNQVVPIELDGYYRIIYPAELQPKITIEYQGIPLGDYRALGMTTDSPNTLNCDILTLPSAI